MKTGGCPEDCAYCPQAARYHTGVQAEPLLETEEVLDAARTARAAGATRFCMGAAWREVKDGPQFERILEMVRGVKQLGLETCCTLGMLTAGQARCCPFGSTARNTVGCTRSRMGFPGRSRAASFTKSSMWAMSALYWTSIRAASSHSTRQAVKSRDGRRGRGRRY